MKTAIATLKSVSTYSQGKYHNTPFKKKESHADHEERTWREKLHVNEHGNVFIPPMQFKLCLANGASYLGEKIKGKGNATYTKHFNAGIIVDEGLDIGIKKEDVDHHWVFVPSDGKPGGGKRVPKCFPVIHHWKGDVKFYILDDIITEDIFTRYLKESGRFIGLGVFRPQNRGYFGRFEVEKVQWIDDEAV